MAVGVLDPVLAADHNQPETSYTPALTATTTSPTLGSGSVVAGRYYQDPITGMVDVNIRITFGTSGTNAGSGTYLVSLPIAIDRLTTGTTLGTGDVVGSGMIRDDSAVATGSRQVTCYSSSTTTVTMGLGDGTSSAVASAAPFAWAASDSISLCLRYPGVLP